MLEPSVDVPFLAAVLRPFPGAIVEGRSQLAIAKCTETKLKRHTTVGEVIESHAAETSASNWSPFYLFSGQGGMLRPDGLQLDHGRPSVVALLPPILVLLLSNPSLN